MKSFVIRNVFRADPQADGRPGSLRNDLQDVRIAAGRFVEWAPAGALQARDSIDGGGQFLTPGLIDCHCHLCGVFLPKIPSLLDMRWIPRQIATNLRAHLASGVTTMRDMGAPLRLILHLRQRATAPTSGFPRILCAGPILTVPGGYPPHVPKDTPWIKATLGTLRGDVKTRRGALRMVDRLADHGVDCVKIGFATRGYDNQPLKVIDRERLRAIVERAHHHDLPVAIHHTWLADLEVLADEAALGRPDSIEHLTMDAPIPASLADRLADRGLRSTTTIECYSIIDRAVEQLRRVRSDSAPLLPKAKQGVTSMLDAILEGRSPAPGFEIEVLRGAGAIMRDNLMRLADHGVLVGAGTDAGTNLVFGSLTDELERMVEAGMTPERALRTATLDAGRLLGRSELGNLEPDSRADFLLCAADPRVDISALRQIESVFRDGVRVVP